MFIFALLPIATYSIPFDLSAFSTRPLRDFAPKVYSNLPKAFAVQSLEPQLLYFTLKHNTQK